MGTVFSQRNNGGMNEKKYKGERVRVIHVFEGEKERETNQKNKRERREKENKESCVEEEKRELVEK